MPAYKDLDLNTVKNDATVSVRGVDVHIKQYLPIQEKMAVITNIINLSGDDEGFYNSAKFGFWFDIEMVRAYTDIDFGDIEDWNAVYDALACDGFFGDMYELIPNSEVNFIYSNAKTTIDRIYQYRNSVYGILDALKTDYSDLDLNVDKLTEQLSNKENVEFLKEVVDKLG